MEEDNNPPKNTEENPSTSDSDLECVEGKRMIRLREAFRQTFEKCTSAGRFNVFARNLKQIYKKDPEGFRNLHGRMIEQLKQHVFEELECMYKEEKVAQSFNKLDELTKNADQGVKAWRPSGDPEKDIQAHLIPVQLEQKEKLKEILKTVESQNRLLQGVLKNKQKKIMEASEKIEAIHQKWKMLTDSFTEENVEELMKFNEAVCKNENAKT